MSEFLLAFVADDHSPVIMELHAHALHDDQLAELVADYLHPRGITPGPHDRRAIDAGAVDESLDAGMVRDLVLGPIICRWLMTKEEADPVVANGDHHGIDPGGWHQADGSGFDVDWRRTVVSRSRTRMGGLDDLVRDVDVAVDISGSRPGPPATSCRVSGR